MLVSVKSSRTVRRDKWYRGQEIGHISTHLVVRVYIMSEAGIKDHRTPRDRLRCSMLLAGGSADDNPGHRERGGFGGVRRGLIRFYGVHQNVKFEIQTLGVEI